MIVSLSAFHRLQELAVVARKNIAQIQAPVLILGSIGDKVASFAKTKALFANNKNTKILEYTKANHIMLYDYEHENMIQEVLKFIESE
jgi:esterase/lipase